MAKSGVKKVTKLRKYINSRPTDEVKDNVVGTEGYIPDVTSNEECPVGCDTVVEGTVLVQGTSTTTTTTTVAPLTELNLFQNFRINNPASSGLVYYEFMDEYLDIQTGSINPGEEVTVSSNIDFIPQRTSGSQMIVSPISDPVVGTTTTSTLAPLVSNDFNIDLSSIIENIVVSYTQPGSTEASETELPGGSVVKITSDTTPTVVSGDQTPTITDLGQVTPEADTYTVVNNDYYESTTVQYRGYLGVSDEVVVGPRETVELVSQDVPTVTGSMTDVDITAAGNPTQNIKPSIIPNRICNQRVLTNDSDYIAVFEYVDCDGIDREVTLEPGEERTVGSITIPTLDPGTSQNVGQDFTVDTVERGYGTSGSATPVVPTTSSTTTLAPTTSTTTERLNVYEYGYGDFIELTYYLGQPTDTKSRWYPKEIKIGVPRRTGTFKFISYDVNTSALIIYRVYEGEPEFSVNSFTSSLVDSDSSMRLDTAICSEELNGRFQSEGYNGLISNGETHEVANAYAYGDKRTEPVIVPGYVSPIGSREKTEFTLNKTTTTDYITVRIYQPYHAGIAGTSAVSYGARFEITDVT